MPRLDLKLAVEKALTRLALLQNGNVTIARLFVELPMTIEEVEAYADELADGRMVVKNEWEDFLSYQFPELVDRQAPFPSGCPTCGGAAPPSPTEGGQEVRAPLLCGDCYRNLGRVHATPDEEGFFDKLKERLFGHEDGEDRVELARLEHEIFHMGLSLGLPQFTHTHLAAQCQHPAQKLGERLESMSTRRYIKHGLLPSGDAVGYSFPPDLTYPTSHYHRLARPGSSGNIGGLKPGDDEESRFKIKRKAPETARPNLKIVIKDRRRRP